MSFFQRNVCEFLNETVHPVEQAHALQIPVDLYNKIVTIRKNTAHKLLHRERINAAVSIIASCYIII